MLFFSVAGRLTPPGLSPVGWSPPRIRRFSPLFILFCSTQFVINKSQVDRMEKSEMKTSAEPDCLINWAQNQQLYGVLAKKTFEVLV